MFGKIIEFIKIRFFCDPIEAYLRQATNDDDLRQRLENVEKGRLYDRRDWHDDLWNGGFPF